MVQWRVRSLKSLPFYRGRRDEEKRQTLHSWNPSAILFLFIPPCLRGLRPCSLGIKPACMSPHPRGSLFEGFSTTHTNIVLSENDTNTQEPAYSLTSKRVGSMQRGRTAHCSLFDPSWVIGAQLTP